MRTSEELREMGEQMVDDVLCLKVFFTNYVLP